MNHKITWNCCQCYHIQNGADQNINIQQRNKIRWLNILCTDSPRRFPCFFLWNSLDDTLESCSYIHQRYTRVPRDEAKEKKKSRRNMLKLSFHWGEKHSKDVNCKSREKKLSSSLIDWRLSGISIEKMWLLTIIWWKKFDWVDKKKRWKTIRKYS